MSPSNDDFVDRLILGLVTIGPYDPKPKDHHDSTILPVAPGAPEAISNSVSPSSTDPAATTT